MILGCAVMEVEETLFLMRVVLLDVKYRPERF